MRSGPSLLALVLAAIAVASPGCATLFKGAQDEIELHSEPPGAKIYLNQEYLGVTPLTLNLAPNQTYYVDLRMPGYQDLQAALAPDFGVGWLVLDLVAPLAGVACLVDAVTGAWSGLPDRVDYRLKR